MKILVILTLVVLCQFNGLVAQDSDRAEWLQFKARFNKVYEDPEEDAMRFSLFMATRQRVSQQISNGQFNGSVPVNEFADWTATERSRLAGLRHDPEEYERQLRLSENDPFLLSIINDPRPVPDHFDWRHVPERVGPVKHQGNCGTCWAFSTTGVLEGQQVVRNLTSTLVPLSEQQLIECVEDSSELGAYIFEAMEGISMIGGIMKSSDYPYKKEPACNETADNCRFEESRAVMTCSGSLVLPPGDEETLKKFVALYGPVAVEFQVTENFKAYAAGQVHYDDKCNGSTNHAVLAVGYGRDPEQGDYWIVVSKVLPTSLVPNDSNTLLIPRLRL